MSFKIRLAALLLCFTWLTLICACADPFTALKDKPISGESLPALPEPEPISVSLPEPASAEFPEAEPVSAALPETPAPSPEPTPTPYLPVTIGCVGDIYFNSAIYTNYKKTDSAEGFLKDGLADCFRDMDIMLANHEYAATDLTDEAKDTRQLYNFKAPTEREFIWREMGVDVVSLANNHALDYGQQGLLDTLDILDAEGILHCGAGTDLEDAKKAAVFDKNGKRFAVLAASRIVVNVDWYATADKPGVLTTYESTRYFQLVKDEITRLKEEEDCDFVMIYVHFGEEGTNRYTDYQELVAHGYIDAGADVVFGGHAHTLQGIEIYNGKPIFYNLGNFLFGGQKIDTVFVEITVAQDDSCTARLLPCISQSYVATLCQGDEKQRILQYIESISKNVTVDEEGYVTETTP